MNLTLSDGLWFELGRVMAGLAIVAAVAVAIVLCAMVKSCLDVYRDRKAREAGCLVCHKKATKFESYNGRKGYLCRDHTLAPAEGAHGFSVPLH